MHVIKDIQTNVKKAGKEEEQRKSVKIFLEHLLSISGRHQKLWNTVTVTPTSGHGILRGWSKVVYQISRVPEIGQ